MSNVRLDSVSKVFDETVAVDGVSLEVEEGEFFSLLGPSGCGKTTTLRMIGGFEEPSEGRIFLGDHEVTHLPPYKRNANTVFQSYALFPHLDVFENVAYGLRRRKLPVGEIKRQVQDILRLVDLTGFERRSVRQLSGGQQQRVALARALVNRPGVLLLDEPLGALDLKLRKQMQLELKRIQSEVGITFIYVTHDQEEAMTMSERLAVMSAGRFEQIGKPQEVYELPRTEFVASFLGASNLLDAELESRNGDIAKVRLKGGGVVAVPSERMPERDTGLRVGVRPEKISLSERTSAPAEATNSVEAIIAMSSYTGVSTSYECTTDDGATIAVYVQNLGSSAQTFAPGTRVRLSWHPDYTFAVEKQAASAKEES